MICLIATPTYSFLLSAEGGFEEASSS